MKDNVVVNVAGDNSGALLTLAQMALGLNLGGKETLKQIMNSSGYGTDDDVSVGYVPHPEEYEVLDVKLSINQDDFSKSFLIVSFKVQNYDGEIEPGNFYISVEDGVLKGDF